METPIYDRLDLGLLTEYVLPNGYILKINKYSYNGYSISNNDRFICFKNRLSFDELYKLTQ